MGEKKSIIEKIKELLDEIAIHSQAQQNLMFAVGEKAHHERIALSHSRDELILKCSFNQRDCDLIKFEYDEYNLQKLF